MALILVGCSSASKTSEQLICTLGDADKSSIVSYTISKNQITEVNLEGTITLEYFGLNPVSDDSVSKAYEEVKSLLGDKVVEESSTEDRISYSVKLDENNISALDTLGIPYDEKLVTDSDTDAITKLYEEAGGTCKITEAQA